MLFILKENTEREEAHTLLAKLKWMNLQSILTQENNRYVIAVLGGADLHTDLQQFQILPPIEQVLPLNQKFKLASRDFKKEGTIISVKNYTIGGNNLTVMAGPCSIESEEQIHHIAECVAAAGANILRGGAFKPRTSPYDFQGLGEIGLQYLKSAAEKYHLASISEVMDTSDIDMVSQYVDILQIGARNMQNFSLLKQIGKTRKPILLKRGLSSTYMEFLMAAEYILQSGNPDVILCERGIRTFETYTRNTLDLAAVPVLKDLSHLPVIVDPSHGTGLRKLVPPMALAAVAAGCDGLMLEVHTEPDKSISDAQQTISTETFAALMPKLLYIPKFLQAE